MTGTGGVRCLGGGIGLGILMGLALGLVRFGFPAAAVLRVSACLADACCWLCVLMAVQTLSEINFHKPSSSSALTTSFSRITLLPLLVFILLWESSFELQTGRTSVHSTSV